MKTSEVITAIRLEAENRAQDDPNATWYLFGSALVDPQGAKDVDVVVIVSSDQHGRKIRENLSVECRLLPVHLLILTEDEERELDFINAQHCVQLYP